MNQMKKEELEITISDSDRIECAIRHIESSLDVDPWAIEIAVEAMKKEISALQAQDSPKPKAESVQNVQNEDLISRKAAIDVLATMQGLCTSKAALVQNSKIWQQIKDLPSAHPEIEERKEEFAQNVPKEDLISRKAAIDALVKAIRKDPYYDSNEAINGLGVCDVRVILNDLPSAQPEREKGEWTKDCACEICGFKPWYERDIHTLSFCPNCGADMRGDNDDQSK